MENWLKLNNPAWHSLNETHRTFAIGNAEIKLYAPEICPFGGAQSIRALFGAEAFIGVESPFFLLGELPVLPHDYALLSELVCAQMVCPRAIQIEISEKIIQLNAAHGEALSQLVNLVQPGYFRLGTMRMGDYFGVFRSGQLIAAAGERMRMEGFTEVSAIVTHPDFRGIGLASQLTAHVVNKNLADGTLPYLHVAESNARAILLYERLGFAHWQQIGLWKIKRQLT